MKLGLSAAGVGIAGTRITIRDPKLSGARKDGQPYEARAATATQDTAGPNFVDLTEVEVRLRQPDGSTTIVTGRTGRFHPDKDRLDLAGSVRFLNEGRYDMRVEQAAIEMREGRIVTDRPAVVTLPDGRFEGDALSLSEPTQTVVLEGRVRSVFNQESSP
jgi:lipopolysaccharide export system protein LptC